LAGAVENCSLSLWEAMVTPARGKTGSFTDQRDDDIVIPGVSKRVAIT
jgi:hypothetical protein